MAAETYLPQIPLWIDVTSVSIGAVSGALTATRLRFDVSGVLLVAIVTGLGGGLIRDSLLQSGPPIALTSRWLLPAVVIAGAATFLFSRSIDTVHSRMGQASIGIDAAFLGVYSIVGTAKALDADLPAVSCVFLGVLTGVGGALLRDVMINREPELLRPGALLAVASGAGCIVFVLSVRVLHVPPGFAAMSIGVIVALRLIAVWRKWESPVSDDVVLRAQRIRRLGRGVGPRASGPAA